jgi:hypothetical protein
LRAGICKVALTRDLLLTTPAAARPPLLENGGELVDPKPPHSPFKGGVREARSDSLQMFAQHHLQVLNYSGARSLFNNLI